VTPVIADAFNAALAVNGLGLLFSAVVVAGLVRGFSGFGSAMIYMPFAGMVLPPVWAVTSILVFDILGTLPIARRAAVDCHPPEVMRLVIGALVALPMGLYLLSRIDSGMFRWAVSLISLTLLALLMAGWRYRGALGRKMTYGVGALGGFLSGVSGLAGPPVIMLYMSSRLPIKTIRANILLCLLLGDVAAIAVMAAMGLLTLIPLVIGVLLVPPYAVANLVGAGLFRPEKERLFRAIAYGLIAFSAVSNLPILR